MCKMDCKSISHRFQVKSFLFIHLELTWLNVNHFEWTAFYILHIQWNRMTPDGIIIVGGLSRFYDYYLVIYFSIMEGKRHISIL